MLHLVIDMPTFAGQHPNNQLQFFSFCLEVVNNVLEKLVHILWFHNLTNGLRVEVQSTFSSNLFQVLNEAFVLPTTHADEVNHRPEIEALALSVVHTVWLPPASRFCAVNGIHFHFLIRPCLCVLETRWSKNPSIDLAHTSGNVDPKLLGIRIVFEGLVVLSQPCQNLLLPVQGVHSSASDHLCCGVILQGLVSGKGLGGHAAEFDRDVDGLLSRSQPEARHVGELQCLLVLSLEVLLHGLIEIG